MLSKNVIILTNTLCVCIGYMGPLDGSYVTIISRNKVSYDLSKTYFVKGTTLVFWGVKVSILAPQSSVASTEKYIDMQLTKAWTAIDKLSIISKSDLTDKMKQFLPSSGRIDTAILGR